MAVYLGLDCGGSSCRAVAVNSSGAILHQGQAGPANLANTPPGKLQNHIIRASTGSPTPDFVCGCFAGLLTAEDRIRAEEILSHLFPGAKVRAEPDYFAALMASPEAELCVIAGTGSVVCSMQNGKLQKSGGRGFILGDYCSAFQFGKAAMLHFLDGGVAQSSAQLVQLIDQRFGSTVESEVLAKLYRGGLAAAQLAKLAPAFAKDMKAGVKYAVETLDVQTGLLAGIVKQHVERYLEPSPNLSICLAGGLWDGSTIFRNAFEAKLRHTLSDRAILITRISKPPVHGAVELAKELAI